MKVVCIVQARFGSTRLPGKVLKEISGKSVLEHDINRIKLVKSIDEIIIATTTEPQDNKIVNEAERLSIKYFRGSEKDVLSRYYHAAKTNNADIVVRITSDCPCLDYNIINEMINMFIIRNRVEKCDYLSNCIERTFPRGYDCEVFSFEVLEEAFMKADKDYEREHVTPYIYNNRYNLVHYKNNEDYSKYRLTLDTEEDFEVINKVYEALFSEHEYFGIEETISFLKQNPEIVKINEEVEQKKLGE